MTDPNTIVVAMAREFGFDSDNFDIASLVRALLKPVVDEGTHIDSGGC